MRSIINPMLIMSNRYLYTTAKCFGNTFPDPIVVESGMDRKQLVERLSGDMDPYSIKVLRRNEPNAGTKEDPNVIHSNFQTRIIGCICEEDSSSIVWTWIHQNEVKKCSCGHWFKLVSKN